MDAPDKRRKLTDEQRHEATVTALSALLTAVLASWSNDPAAAVEQMRAAKQVVEQLESDLGDPSSPSDLH